MTSYIACLVVYLEATIASRWTESYMTGRTHEWPQSFSPPYMHTLCYVTLQLLPSKGEMYLLPFEIELSQVVCFAPWDVSGHDASIGLKESLSVWACSPAPLPSIGEGCAQVCPPFPGGG